MSEENLTSVGEPIIQLTENGAEGFEILCRLCANRSDHLIPIYSEEGISNDLADKMNMYLPIKISKADVLPLQCCFQCATTVLTWHELVVASVEADRRLREVQAEVEKQIVHHNVEPGPSQVEPVEDRCATVLKTNHPTINSESDNNETETTHLKIRKTFQCAQCTKYFFQKSSLERHFRIHKNERPFICEVCGKGFRDNSALVRHIRHVHIRTKDFPCDICRQTFASAATRDDHRRSHTKECPFTCQICGKNFGRKASLYIHSKLHIDVFPFKCSVCEKKFRRRQELVNHVTTHSGEKQFACDMCGKCFRLRTFLNKHKLIHSENKPFTCKVCGVSYRQARYLRKHTLKHDKNS